MSSREIVDSIRQRLKANKLANNVLKNNYERPLQELVKGYSELAVYWLEKSISKIIDYWCKVHDIELDSKARYSKDEIESKLCIIDEELGEPLRTCFKLLDEIDDENIATKVEPVIGFLKTFVRVVEQIEDYDTLSKEKPNIDKELSDKISFITRLFNILKFELAEVLYHSEGSIYLLFKLNIGIKYEYREVFISDDFDLLKDLEANVKNIFETDYPITTSLVLTNNYLILNNRDYNAFTVDTIISSIFNSKKYWENLRETDFSNSKYIDIKLKGDILKYDKEKQNYTIYGTEDVDTHIDNFLETDHRNIFVVSKAGGGKSFFCRKVFENINSQIIRSKFAFYFDLSNMGRSKNINKFINDSLVDYFSINTSSIFDVINFLSSEGKIILIFDGLDEILEQDGEIEDIIEVFGNLSKLFTSKSKIIITSRQTLLQSSKYINELLDKNAVVSDKVSYGLTAEGIDPLQLPNFSIIKLLDLELDTIEPDISSSIHVNSKNRILKSTPLIIDLFQRIKITTNSEKFIDDQTKELDLTKVIYQIILQHLEHDDELMMKIAKYFCESYQNGISAFELLNIVGTLGSSVFRSKFTYEEFILKDLFKKVDRNTYNFVHKSFYEFLFSYGYCLDSDSVYTKHSLNEDVRSHINTIHNNRELFKIDAFSYNTDKTVIPGKYLLGEYDSIKIFENNNIVRFDEFPVTVKEYNEFLLSIEGTDISEFEHPSQPKEIDHNPNYKLLKKKDYYKNPKYLNFPAICITWWSAYAFAKFNEKRLPTSEEWECASRGMYGNIFPWGDKVDIELANCADFWAQKLLLSYDSWKKEFDKNTNFRAGETTDVFDFEENISPFGVKNMSGNVWELTSTLTEDYERVVICGGSFDNPFKAIKCCSKGLAELQVMSNAVGFRCCQTLKK